MIQYIVFTADVQTPQAGKLRDAITKAVNAGATEIYLFISSPGGNVGEGLGIAALMKTLSVNIITHNIGHTDSIANLIFAAGSPRYATKDSSFSLPWRKSNFRKAILYRESARGTVQDTPKITREYGRHICNIYRTLDHGR